MSRDEIGSGHDRLLARRAERRGGLRRRQRIGLAGGILGLAAVAGTVLAVATTAGHGSGAPVVPARAHTVSPVRDGVAPSQAVRHPPVGRKPGAEPVPILMYHVIAPPFANSPYPGLYVPPAEFDAQMEALAHAGYHAVTLDEVRSYWLHGTPLPSKPIVLSFDNGYHSQYTQALPMLRRLGWVGVESIQLSGLPPSQGGLSGRQVRALVAAHWELDTQGFTHADLITLDAASLHHEVAVSRQVIRRRYGVPVNWFCYPSGHYDATVIAAVKAAGYAGATTVVFGWSQPAEDLYRLPRLRVLGGTSPAALLAMISAARDDPPPPSAYPTG